MHLADDLVAGAKTVGEGGVKLQLVARIEPADGLLEPQRLVGGTKDVSEVVGYGGEVPVHGNQA